MRFYITLFTVLITLSGCNLLSTEMKKTEKMRNAAMKVCNCAFVSVSSEWNNGQSSVVIVVSDSEEADIEENSKEILNRIKCEMNQICSYRSIEIKHEGQLVSDSFIYRGCDQYSGSPEVLSQNSTSIRSFFKNEPKQK